MSAACAHVALAHDASLPQRDLLLDAGVLAHRLSARLGARGTLDIDACARVRTKYRVGDSLRIAQRIGVGGRDYTVAARAFAGRDESLRAYERARAAAADICAPLRPVAHDAELATVFWTFPNDRRVMSLRAFADVPAELARLVAPAWTRSRVVAYAPEKCATAQCLDARGRVVAYAKVYAGDEGRRVHEIYRAIAGLRRATHSTVFNRIAFPRALAYDETHHLLLLAPCAGRRVADLRGGELVRGYVRLGRALAALHSLPVPAGLPQFKRLQASRVAQAARIVARARPGVRCAASVLADELTRGRASFDHAADVCLHGDVHPKNGLLQGERLALIDLDQAAAGHPAADLGSLLASLTYQSITGLCTRARAHMLGGACLEGYASVRALPCAASLRWHTAAALLAERALRAVNRIRPEGLAHLHELLDAARTILRAGGTR